jgi:hypothetical protein
MSIHDDGNAISRQRMNIPIIKGANRVVAMFAILKGPRKIAANFRNYANPVVALGPIMTMAGSPTLICSSMSLSRNVNISRRDYFYGY